jgi:hypothetical protein
MKLILPNPTRLDVPYWYLAEAVYPKDLVPSQDTKFVDFCRFLYYNNYTGFVKDIFY